MTISKAPSSQERPSAQNSQQLTNALHTSASSREAVRGHTQEDVLVRATRSTQGKAKVKGGAAPGDVLLRAFSGPHGGVPAFDKIRVDDFKPALLRAMDMQRAEIKAITDCKDAPTFANTIRAFEDSGRAFGRASTLLGIYTSALNDKKMQAIEAEMAPVLAAYADKIVQNTALFARIKQVHDTRHTLKLAPDELRLVETVYKSFVLRGAALNDAEKARLKTINQELASLYTAFSQNQLADEETAALVIDDARDLAGLPESYVAAIAAAAKVKGLEGKWLVSNTRSAVEPFLTYSTRRELRERAWQVWTSRGEHAGAHDNRPIMTQILAKRAERAKLLGYPTHAHWTLDNTMAKTPDAAMDLMMKVWPAAVRRVREEVADMQRIADGEGAGHTIAPWDYRFYAEKVRKAKYDIDQNELKPYLQADKLRDAMFWAAGQLYGLSFTQVRDVPVYHPDMQVWEVTRHGQRVGLWYFDPYARDGKRSGAWMSEYRTQETFNGSLTPIVSNNSNFVKGKPGEPVLISWDDAKTLFHEFGHALHGLLSSVRFPTLAGTNTLRDFVEFPSQINERWLTTPEVLNRFCVHYETGKPIPAELLKKLDDARHFNKGFETVEYMMSAIYDLKIHMQDGGEAIDPIAFERQTMRDIGAPAEIVMRHRPPHFGHIFAGDGYSAGYYSYLWSDALTADATEAFLEAGGLYDPTTAKRFHDTILSVGNSLAPEEGFRRFRGRDVDTNALMRDRGFPAAT